MNVAYSAFPVVTTTDSCFGMSRFRNGGLHANFSTFPGCISWWPAFSSSPAFLEPSDDDEATGELHAPNQHMPTSKNMEVLLEASIHYKNLCHCCKTFRIPVIGNPDIPRKMKEKRDEDTSSPTVMTESVLLTAAIEAKENMQVVTLDIPNAFIQMDAGRGNR